MGTNLPGAGQGGGGGERKRDVQEVVRHWFQLGPHRSKSLKLEILMSGMFQRLLTLTCLPKHL